MDPSFQKAKGWVWQKKNCWRRTESYSIEEFWFHKPLVSWSTQWFKPKNPTLTHDFSNLLTIWINFEISRFQRRIHVLDRDNMIKNKQSLDLKVCKLLEKTPSDFHFLHSAKSSKKHLTLNWYRLYWSVPGTILVTINLWHLNKAVVYKSHTLLTGVEEILLFVGFEGFGWTTRVGFRAKIWSTSICNEKRDA